MDSLYDNRWVDYACVNLYLYAHWTALEDPPVRYISTELLRPWANPDRYQYDLRRIYSPGYRFNYNLPSEGTLPIVPLIFVVLEGVHFFVVAMDHSQHAIWVIGRSTSRLRGDRWDEWAGREYYQHLCVLHGWEPGDLDTVRRYSVVVEQDGINCGPTAVACALWLFRHGIVIHNGSLTTPPHACPHLTRMSIFTELCQILHRCSASYDMRAHNPPREWCLAFGTDADAIDALPEHNMEGYREPLRLLSNTNLSDHEVFRSLRSRIMHCPDCARAGDVFRMWHTALQNMDTTGPPLDFAVPDAGDEAHMSEAGEGDTAAQTPGTVDALEVFMDKIRYPGRKRQSPKSYGHLNPKRFPRPVEPIPLPDQYQPVWVAHSELFDDYHTGPTQEELQVENPHLGDVHAMYTFDPITKHILPSCWTRFVDQGFRTLAGFAHMHHLNRPWRIRDHVLSAAALPYEARTYFTAVHQRDSHLAYLKEHRKMTRAEGERTPPPEIFGPPDNVVFMGLQEMLDARHSARPGCTDNLNLFIRGYNRRNKLVCLDIERDSVRPDDILVQIDIDSLIWVTHRVRVQTHINLAISPTISKTPPIRKNNHVYVRLTPPPTQAQRDEGVRGWEEMMVPLSTIPHTIFAKVNEGSSPIYIIIAFPRMLHRNSVSHKWEVKIPLEIQQMFWDRVLLPAMSKHTSKDRQAHAVLTVEHILLKSGSASQRNGNLFRAKTLPIEPDALWAMQGTMRKIIADNPNLGLFGSFFFVMDGKNLKLPTRIKCSDISSENSPWARLKKEYSALDLDYMVNRAHGELTIDLGISFTPLHTEELTGLWRLDALEASFGAGGYQRGSLHHIASLSRYGALQAPMGAERARMAHVVYRSSYNLQYEAIRPSDNVPFFAQDGDAYQVNATFKAECNRRITLFEEYAQKGTFGVRDEYRISGEAVMSFFADWQDKVCVHDPRPASRCPEWQTLRQATSSQPSPSCGFRQRSGSSTLLHGLRNSKCFNAGSNRFTLPITAS